MYYPDPCDASKDTRHNWPADWLTNAPVYFRDAYKYAIQLARAPLEIRDEAHDCNGSPLYDYISIWWTGDRCDLSAFWYFVNLGMEYRVRHPEVTNVSRSM